MHQVRYFLAVVGELNFTRAAEKCNVSQPSLTRAIKQPEGELGGDLFRRERPQAQLTELGERMQPLLKQCYESALGARSLASAIKGGDIGALRLALSTSISLEPLTPHLQELQRLFNRHQLQLLRGNPAEIVEMLKQGKAELAVGADINQEWDRLDSWPLFSERFDLIASSRHPLAAREVEVKDLRHERLLRRPYCEKDEQLVSILRGHEVDFHHGHEVPSDRDLISLLEADLGVAIVPRSLAAPETLTRTPIKGVELRRTVYLYGVAGRQRTAVAAAVLKLMRATDWSRYAN